jgi:hypothetical protein
MKESDISRAIQIEATKQGYRFFRQNVGMGWTGDIVAQGARQIVLDNYRPLRAGLCTGSGDQIGWVPTIIRDVPVALFGSIEVKTARGRVSAEQQNFMEQVNAAHGIAIIARSPDEAMEKIAAAIYGLNI